MRRFCASLAVLSALSLPAIAGGWSNFDNTFPAMPCQDGWAACLVDGAAAGPGAQKDAAGRPLPADARFGWFDLKPTNAVSPFASLSVYSGPVGVVAAAPPPPEAPPEAPPAAPPPVDDGGQVASNTSGGSSGSSSSGVGSSGGYTGGSTSGSSSSGSTSGSTAGAGNTSAPVANNTATASTAGSSTTTTTSGGGMRPGSPSNPGTTTAATTTTTTSGGGMRPGSPSNPGTTTTTTTASPGTPVSQPPPTTSNPPPNTTTSVVAPVASGPQDDSCDDLVKLEPAAMMGQLRVGQSKCLDGRINSESAQTTKDKISRLLISNAENKGDKAEWERLIKRHLEDIDRSDPDLCFKYALHLSRGGVGRAQGVIRWADYALENKARWSGTTYKQRVFNLYKLRAEAANKLWQEAEKEFAEGERSDEKEAKAAKHRGQAKDYAREWLDYAKASEQDTKTAMALCVSSSGNRAFCEGG